MRRLLSCLLAVVATPIMASPPPSPPAFVVEAGEVLRDPASADANRVARFFADDVIASENGTVVARGKADWLAWRTAAMAHYEGRTLGYAEGWRRDIVSGGELMVVDTFDDLDRSKLSPTFIVDPRPKTRTTLYRFASDHLIHAVEMVRVESFLVTR